MAKRGQRFLGRQADALEIPVTSQPKHDGGPRKGWTYSVYENQPTDRWDASEPRRLTVPMPVLRFDSAEARDAHAALTEENARQVTTEKRIREALCKAGRCGDGSLPDLVARAIEETQRDTRAVVEEEQAPVSAVFSACWRELGDATGELPPAIRAVVAERDGAHQENERLLAIVKRGQAAEQEWEDERDRLRRGIAQAQRRLQDIERGEGPVLNTRDIARDLLALLGEAPTAQTGDDEP